MTLREQAEAAATKILYEDRSLSGWGDECAALANEGPHDVAVIADAIESVARAFAEKALRQLLKPSDPIIAAAIAAAESAE